MRKVRVDAVVDHLDRNIRKALSAAVTRTAPGTVFDEQQLFREFKKELRAKCETWEYVPACYIQEVRRD